MADPPSPENPARPFPATVEMIPLVSTIRIRLLPASAIYNLPDLSTTMLIGRFSLALVAKPKSPEYPEIPFPATVVITPLILIFLTRQGYCSVINRFPYESTAKPLGEILTLVAITPSPSNAPPPPYVEIIPLASTFLTLLFKESLIKRLLDKSTAMP